MSNPERMAILIPWFNKLKYAPQTIDSLVALRGTRHEVLIVDDCSTDGAAEYVKDRVANRPGFQWRQNERNLHIAKTSRRLISWAHWLGYDIVGFMDCDDLIEPQAVERVLDFYAEPPYKGFVFTQFRWCNPDLWYQGPGFAQAIPEGHTALEGLGGNVAHWRTFRLREYYKTDGFEEETQQCSDKDLMWKFEEVCKLHFLDEELYTWRGWAEGSLTAGADTRGMTMHHHGVAEHRARERRSKYPTNWLERRNLGLTPWIGNLVDYEC